MTNSLEEEQEGICNTEKESKEEVEQREFLEALDALPDEDKQEAVDRVVCQFSKMHSGPIPSPEEMELYNKIEPGLANRIMIMAEENGRHIRICEKKEVDENSKYNARGQIYGFIVTLFALGLCGLSLWFDKDFLSFMFGAAGITPIISRFINPRKIDDEKNN